MIISRLEALRAKMLEAGIDYLIVPSGDYHQSEYVGNYFRSLEYITGFSGSAGTALIPLDSTQAPLLWTDGRYFIQAQAELAESSFELMRIGGLPEVPSLQEWLSENVGEGKVIGFDGRLLTSATVEHLLSKTRATINTQRDLIGEVWDDRPKLVVEHLFELGVELTGETSGQKLARIREALSDANARYHLVTSLDDVAWITNLRGREFGLSPLFLGFCLIGESWAKLYVDSAKLTKETVASLEGHGFEICPYEDVYTDVEALNEGNILLDRTRVSYTLDSLVTSTKIDGPNPSTMLKACKNDIELDNIRQAHIKDGIVQTRFMYWLKTNIGKLKMDEVLIANKLRELRSQQEGFLWNSFEPICAYNENAAMMHYRAMEDTAKVLHQEGLLLTDSGGNYLQGSTDTTRTYALGKLSDEIILHFTTVVRGMVALSDAKFLKGITGVSLDAIARSPIWNLGIDYKSGTGHGVGYLTTIHEGPCSIRWNSLPNSRPQSPIEEGMVLTNEPGIYIEGSHGIRIENELIVQHYDTNAHGTFLCFEPITLTPIDLDAINPSILSQEERTYLNWYHKLVFEKISPYLHEEERDWLKTYTRPV